MNVCAKRRVLTSINLGGEAEINPNAQHWVIGRAWVRDRRGLVSSADAKA